MGRGKRGEEWRRRMTPFCNWCVRVFKGLLCGAADSVLREERVRGGGCERRGRIIGRRGDGEVGEVTERDYSYRSEIWNKVS